MKDAAPDNPDYTYPSFPNGSKNYDSTSEDISSHSPSDNGSNESLGNFIEVISYAELVTCIFGAVGNGIVIWLLGFRIKRNPFSTYVLNLAVADFGVLLSVIVNTVSPWLIFIASFDNILMVSFNLILLMYSTSQFLLTAISIDRCVAVYFPLWHRCHRPPHLSTIVCALVWVLSVLLTAITGTLQSLNLYVIGIEGYYQFMVNAALCLPVITIATVSLFVKVCLKARQHRRGRLLTIVLLTLLFFLLFAFPLNVMKILSDLGYVQVYMPYGALLASLYFLTAISLERCLSVLFPIWYRCHRPRRSSIVVSFLLWIIPGLLSGMLLAFDYYFLDEKYLKVLNAIFTVNLLVFTPIMVASTLIMSIKIFCSSQKRQPPRLYITILVTLLFFIIFAVPLSVMHFIGLNSDHLSYIQYDTSFLFTSFNSSINPIIYYFVGRDRKRNRGSLKVVLKRAFRDEAMCQGGT
ncbi:PREDICTED: LOW QUALITY PROTEIN: mas-related G-protein coupled receptor member D-like [Gekko japonicus]|uniref:LOW QUALITY PROTEIN: mas-related G-protein coupled receptor member D-like n=1 Tax=Gekko japonicus TaxID=146911 RepID=A0ABM1K4P5_GEKJA|nr:PREDICTED: LOW QUALITY PROTEIN: mas-related G-protein coupled receptor member D-like [Gekko japonicus]